MSKRTANQRTLWLTRGLPGSGKTTWLERQGLTGHTLSMDGLRLMLGGLVLDEDGQAQANAGLSSEAQTVLATLLEARMKRGDFTVVDRCHAAINELQPYVDLARRYRYQVAVVDFTDVTPELALARNQARSAPYRVPGAAIDRMRVQMEAHARHWPKPIRRLMPEQAERYLDAGPEDWSYWKRVHHIGDLQGCYQVLLDYLSDEGFHDDEMYLFTGDYVDRGREHERLLPFLFSLAGRPNVRFLEGNHERQLWYWATGQVDRCSEIFREKTLPHLSDVSLPDAESFCRQLELWAHYRYQGTEVFVSHGGVTAVPDRPALVATREYTNGSGPYGCPVDEVFTRNGRPHQYQVHGHRNPDDRPIRAGARGFCLEGKVEHGGALRAVILEPAGFRCVEQDNHTYREFRQRCA
ncbi:AAA family ATPase [Thiomonas sp.]